MSGNIFRRKFLAGSAGLAAVPAAMQAQAGTQGSFSVFSVDKFGAVADAGLC